MKRYLLALLVAGGGGCEGDDKPPPLAPKSRSQAIVAPEGQPAAEAVKPATKAATPAESARSEPRNLCAGQLERPGKPLSRVTLTTQVAEGEQELPKALPLGDGKWTWLNFWAAWCIPCREEIPRLMSWESQLNDGRQRFRLVFVSLDDDPRQLTKFLADQPKSGLRRTFWIKEGETREKWFGAIDMEPDPQLPAHILVDSAGLARCIVRGAVEDGDFAAVRRIIDG
jgi:thiol-disulfide isomerase/thioredoxin